MAWRKLLDCSEYVEHFRGSAWTLFKRILRKQRCSDASCAQRAENFEAISYTLKKYLRGCTRRAEKLNLMKLGKNELRWIEVHLEIVISSLYLFRTMCFSIVNCIRSTGVFPLDARNSSCGNFSNKSWKIYGLLPVALCYIPCKFAMG